MREINRQGKRSSQKQFLQTMIITGIVGASIMLMVALYMIKLFAPKKVKTIPDQLPPMVQNQEDKESKSMVGVIELIGTRNKNIILRNTQENETLKMQIKNQTEIKDSYGKLMSKQELQIGDILEVIYEQKSSDILILQKSDQAWERRDITSPKIDDEYKTIKIGNKQYDYTSDILIINEQLEQVEIGEINPFDRLTIKGLNNTVWSVQVLESAGYLQLINLANQEGSIEINNNQRYNLKEIQDNISLPAGSHKIVIRMKGYLPLAKTINIATGEAYGIDLKDAQEAIARLNVKVTNTQIDYKVEIDNKTYKKGEIIEVKPGKHSLRLTAEEFKTVEMQLALEDGEVNINVRLEPKPVEVEPTEPKEPKVDKPTLETPKLEKPKVEIPKVGNNQPAQEVEEEIKTVQISIETDPIEAQVFIGGIYKGTTPALTDLRPGEYSISIEKQGYSTLYSTIVIDASNAQKGFLYTLQKQE